MWAGEYYHKPHRFEVHEELAGRLVFDLADEASSARATRAIRLAEDGRTSGATFVEAEGRTTYRSAVHKEGGDCTPAAPGSDRPEDPPFVGDEQASVPWESRAPGSLLIVLQGAEPVGVAFAPKAVRVESSHRLLCGSPETVRRWQTYRPTARFGVLVERSAEGPGTAGAWTIERGRTAHGGYTATATYRFVVRQRHPALADSSASIGRLEVTKSFVVTWEVGAGAADATGAAAASSSRQATAPTATGSRLAPAAAAQRWTAGRRPTSAS